VRAVRLQNAPRRFHQRVKWKRSSGIQLERHPSTQLLEKQRLVYSNSRKKLELERCQRGKVKRSIALSGRATRSEGPPSERNYRRALPPVHAGGRDAATRPEPRVSAVPGWTTGPRREGSAGASPSRDQPPAENNRRTPHDGTPQRALIPATASRGPTAIAVTPAYNPNWPVRLLLVLAQVRKAQRDWFYRKE